MNLEQERVEIETWKKALLTLADKNFFYIMKNYFGETKTPFNKHKLIDKLSSYLRNQQTQTRIFSIIDKTDAQLISAISFLDGVPESQLFNFFQNEKSYLELHYQLLNLEERLLIYRVKQGDTTHIHLCPLLKAPLTMKCVSMNLLFPTTQLDLNIAVHPWFTVPFLLSLLSYLWKNSDLLKVDGSFKKRIEEEIVKVFPPLREKGDPPGLLRKIKQSLLLLELINIQENRIVTPFAKLKAFAEQQTLTAYGLLWGAFATVQEQDSSLKPTDYPNKVAAVDKRAKLLLSFIQEIPASQGFSQDVVKKQLFFLQQKIFGFSEDRLTDSVFVTLKELNILIEVSPDGKPLWTKNPRIDDLLKELEDQAPFIRPSIIIQPNFEITVKPQIPLSHGLILALISDLKKFDIYPHLEISKASLYRGFDQHYEIEQIIPLLEKMNGQPLPQNMIYSFKEWERDYHSLTLTEGVILQVSKERLHLIEHSEQLKPWIKKTLAKGVFLLDMREREGWETALRKSGIEILPQWKNQSTNYEADYYDLPFSFDLPQSGFYNRRNHKPADFKETPPPFTQELLRQLASLALSKEQQEEILARINKKLILFPDQIHQDILKNEITEAKGLDYLGKVRLIEQAIHSEGELLETIVRTKRGEPLKLLLKPMELQKSQTELMLTGKSLPDEKILYIKVGKISLVRKLKSSLYAI